jgi:hypothetical protein
MHHDASACAGEREEVNERERMRGREGALRCRVPGRVTGAQAAPLRAADEGKQACRRRRPLARQINKRNSVDRLRGCAPRRRRDERAEGGVLSRDK